jgi:hypothetical protein
MAEQAIMTYTKGNMGINAAFRMFNVPEATLRRRVHGGTINALNHVQALY